MQIRHRLVVGVLLGAATAVFAQASGVVRDSATLQPIAGARVSQQAAELETVSNAAGGYVLTGHDGGLRVAAKKGYFNGWVAVANPGADADILLEAVPVVEDPAYALVPPEACQRCHEAQFTQWKDSPMGKAGTNTWVYDVYDGSGTDGGLGGFVYTRDSVLAKVNPESECAACHQPELWLAAPYSALAPLDASIPEVAHGISCEICHKLADVDESKPNTPGLWPGAVKFSRPAPGQQVQYGLLGDVSYATTKMRASFQPQLAGAVCMVCHQDKNDPDDDGDFEEPNGVISEPTWLEWLASDYASAASPKFASCVDCHMRPVPGMKACEVLNPPFTLARPPGDVRAHSFPGTTPEFLENAVSLAVDAGLRDRSLEVEVVVTNDRTGHHVPTGVTIRNVVLLVEATGPDGGALAQQTGERLHALAGVGDPAKGMFAGLPGRLYAKVNGNDAGTGPTFFTDATGILWDSRIPALASDATRYQFTLPPEGGEVRLRTRLIYRRSWRALVDAKGWTTDGHGQPLADLAPPHFGHLMEHDERSFTAPAAPPDAGCVGCDGGSGPPVTPARGCGCGGAPAGLFALWLVAALGWSRRRRSGSSAS